MDETRRFLRYLIPGMLFFGELLLFCCLLHPHQTWESLQALPNGLGSAVTGLAVAGTLGYVFSVIHHHCQWCTRCNPGVLDHTANIQALVSANKLATLPVDSAIDREQALIQTLLVWHPRLRKDGAIQAADGKVSSLSDLAHGAGTARVASAAALATLLVLQLGYDPFGAPLEFSARWLAVVALGVILTVIFHTTYKRTGRIAQRLIDELVKKEIEPPTSPSVAPGPTSSQG